MCIICDKPAGVEMPSEEDIRYMFEKNPNGAGFAIQGWFEHKRKNKITKEFEVHYHKGFMTIDELLEALGDRETLKPFRVVIHCRITTSGNSDRPTTHPFPLSSNYGDLRKTDGDGPVLFHNGVFSGLGNIVDKKSSDTQDYTIGIANRMLKNPAHISATSKKIAEIVAGSCRVLILYPDPAHPEFRLGTWHEYQGRQYSNINYKKTTYNYSSSAASTQKGIPAYSRYDDDDYEDFYQGYGAKNSIKSAPKKDAGHDIDEWGCNHANLAFPCSDTHWIQFPNRARYNAVRSAYHKTDIQNGQTYYYFAYNTTRPWVFDLENLRAYDQEGAALITEKVEAQKEEYNQLWLDNVIYFDSLEEMQEFFEGASHINGYSAFIQGETWYFDKENMVAYTDTGLGLVYKSGEVGHVRAALLKDGKDTYTKDRKEIEKYLQEEEEELETLGGA